MTYDHTVSDQLQCHFAAKISNTLRKSDFEVRPDIDELPILLKDLQQQEKKQASRVFLSFEGISVHTGGIYTYPREFIASERIEQADAAMYKVKYNGRNAYR